MVWLTRERRLALFPVGEKTSYFHTAGNEVMEPIFLLFNCFHRTGIFQFAFNSIQDGRMGEVQKGSLLVSLNTLVWPLALIFFHTAVTFQGHTSLKVLNLNQDSPSKQNCFFWSNLSLIKMLNQPKFGHMTTSFFFYRYIITHTLKQHKSTIIRYNILRLPGKNIKRNS